MKLILYYVLCLLVLVTFTVGPAPAADPTPKALRLGTNTVVRYATVVEAKNILGRRDRFVNSLSRFDLESRTGKLGATRDDYLHWVTEQARPWDEQQKLKLSQTLGTIRGKLAGLKLPLPKTILLVHTTDEAEAGAAHCRQNAIVLPSRMVGRPAMALQRLLVHELFHIASSHNPQWQNRLYEVIGFRSCQPVTLPASLRDREITNPDAPAHDHYIQIESDGRKVKAIPILLASVDRFDPEAGGSFFRYLQFWLMVVDSAGERWKPVMQDGRPLLIQPKGNASFFSQIGRNTNYIYHPEEILAENFVHLALGTKTTQLQNPELIDKLRQQLAP